jgi:hypothetical protein
MGATAEHFCAFCMIDGKLTPSITWEGAPICGGCLADAMSNRVHLPRCPLSDVRSRELQPAPSPSPGLPAAVATLQ